LGSGSSVPVSVRSLWHPAAVTNLPLATGHGDVDEATGVSESLLRAALGGLLLLLGLNLLPACQPPFHFTRCPRVLVRIMLVAVGVARCVRVAIAERMQLVCCLPWLQSVSYRCFCFNGKVVTYESET
jgi:hypothetical protein